MQGVISFRNIILAHAAGVEARLRGAPMTTLVVDQRLKASQVLLYHYQQHPNDISNAKITAALSAAALECPDACLGQRGTARSHLQMAVQTIRDRGGPPALMQNRRLQMFVNWTDYILPGYDSHEIGSSCSNQPLTTHADAHEARAFVRAQVA
jgi:hypothetical protein